MELTELFRLVAYAEGQLDQPACRLALARAARRPDLPLPPFPLQWQLGIGLRSGHVGSLHLRAGFPYAALTIRADIFAKAQQRLLQGRWQLTTSAGRLIAGATLPDTIDQL